MWFKDKERIQGKKKSDALEQEKGNNGNISVHTSQYMKCPENKRDKEK